MSCAIRVGVVINDCPCAVFNIRNSVENDRGDGVSTYILNIQRCCAGGIGDAGYGIRQVGGHSGDDFGHGDVEGKGPCGVVTSAVLIAEGERFRSRAIFDATGNSRIRWCDWLSAGIRNFGQVDAHNRRLIFTVYITFSRHLADVECGGSVDDDELLNGTLVSALVGDRIGTCDGNITGISNHTWFAVYMAYSKIWIVRAIIVNVQVC